MVRSQRLLLVLFVQVISQSVYFAQGILNAQELEQDEGQESAQSAMATWQGACAVILYAAIQHISGLWLVRYVLSTFVRLRQVKRSRHCRQDEESPCDDIQHCRDSHQPGIPRLPRPVHQGYMNIKPSSRRNGVCVTAAIFCVSGPCWRKIIGGSGSRLTATLGVVAVVCFMVLAAFQQPPYGILVYGLGAGAGIAVIHLYLKRFDVSLSGDQDLPFWNVGVAGVGLASYPLLAYVFSSSYGPRLTLLPLAAVALHALPIMLLLNSTEQPDDQNEVEDHQIANLELTSDDVEEAASGPSTRTGSERLSEIYLSSDQSLLFYRMKLPYMAWNWLPGIPEEDEHEQEEEEEEEVIACHRHILQRTSIDESKMLTNEYCNMHNDYSIVNLPKAITSHKSQRISLHHFNCPLLSVITLFRLGNDTCITAIIFFLPIYSNHVELHMPIKEKAFLLSICGFSMMLAEFSIYWLIAKVNCSSFLCSIVAKKFKRNISGFPIFVSIAPLISTFGLYLIWKSKNIDAITVAGLVLGIGSGSCTIVLRILERKMPSEICQDFTDFAAGLALIGSVFLVKTLVLSNAIEGYFLFAGGIYVLTSLVSMIALR